MGKGASKDTRLVGAATAVTPAAEVFISANRFIALDRAYPPKGTPLCHEMTYPPVTASTTKSAAAKSKPVRVIRAEYLRLPEWLVEDGSGWLAKDWCIDYPYPATQLTQSYQTSPAKDFRLGGLLLRALDLFRAGNGSVSGTKVGTWGYLVRESTEETRDPETGKERVLTVVFDEKNSEGKSTQAFFDTVTKSTLCTCPDTSYETCPHQAFMFLGYIAGAANEAASNAQAAGDDPNHLTSIALRSAWSSWLASREKANEGDTVVRLLNAFTHYLEANPSLGYTSDSQALDADLDKLRDEANAELAKREGGGVVTEEGDFRIPMVDEIFAEVAKKSVRKKSDYSADEIAVIPPYQRDLTINKNFEIGLRTVANNLLDGTAKVFGFFGPKGTGKDTIAMTIAAALNRPVYRFDCTNATNLERELGGDTLEPNVDVKDVEGKEVKIMHDGSRLVSTVGPLGAALRDGAVVIIDEVISADANMRTALHMAAQEGYFTLRGVKSKSTHRIKLHPDTVIICTWNPSVDGGRAEIPGEAFTDRMVTVACEPVSSEEVAKMLAKYLNVTRANEENYFSTEDCMDLAVFMQERIPKVFTDRTLKRTGSFRTVKTLANSIFHVVRANQNIAQNADAVVAPLDYLCNQTDPALKKQGRDFLRSEFSQGDPWDSKPLVKKMRDLVKRQAAASSTK